MKIAYKWVRPSNPAEPLQDEMLRKAGFTDLSPTRSDVYRDAPTKTRRLPGDDPLPALKHAIMALHPGDVLCIPFPQCFAHTEPEAMRRLAAIGRAKASLYIASMDVTISVTPEMEPVLSFLAARAEPFNKQRTEAARKHLNAKQRATLLRKIREVKPLWTNPDKTVTQIVAETKRSRSTLYRWQRLGLLPNVRKASP